MAIIRFAEDSFLDVESIEFITGNYKSKTSTDWKTDLVVRGVPMTIEGQPGKNIMDAYLWQWRHSAIDMIPGDKYKKNLF